MSGPTHVLRRLEAEAMRLYAANKSPDLTPSRTYGNSTTTGSYTRPPMGGNRAGADDHLLHGSLGMGPQIAPTQNSRS